MGDMASKAEKKRAMGIWKERVRAIDNHVHDLAAKRI